MSQPPSYVVRQDSGGKLKLLLVRDPRAAHVAAKLSPVKKQPPLAPTPQLLPAVSSSPPSRGTISAAEHRSLRAIETTAASSSVSGAPSAFSLAAAPGQAMAHGELKTTEQYSGGASPAKEKVGKTEGGRVKEGKIIKLLHGRPSSKKSPSASSSSSSAPSLSGSSRVPRPKSGRGHQSLLPVSRVKTIMRTDVHTSHISHSISQDSVALVAKATELFIAQLARGAHRVAVSEAERDVSYRHLSSAVRREKRTEFLHDILPAKVAVRDYLVSLSNQMDHTHSCSTSSSN